jgi:oligo-alginate lyase
MRLLITIGLITACVFAQAQHPITFFTKQEAAEVKNNLSKYPLLQRSFADMKRDVDGWTNVEVHVPVPKDQAGGYTHEAHKSNYSLMFYAGLLYNITGEKKYADLVRHILLKYAALNPTLKKHPAATSSSPGRIFWQALNDANWLVYTGMAYDLVRNSFTPADRKTIEEGAFRPEVEYLTKDLRSWFDLIHNHGVWACAGVGIVGIATDNKDYVDMALYGTAKDGKSGFIAQMDNLFSPDGYYTEGPYYARYAILPYYIFANALRRAKPALKIFEHRDGILQKALIAALQQTNIDGKFFPLNDALKDKDFTSSELVLAINIAFDVYGKNEGMLAVAKKQGRVSLNNGGVAIAAALAKDTLKSNYYPYASVEYRDGVKGNEGGVSFLRTGKNERLTSLIFKYTSHGLSHGHFDKLNISVYDRGNEILTDYGSVRFVNVDQKNGGRYLPENDAYASQTIAHNTLVVDEASHFNGNEKISQQHHPQKLYSSIGAQLPQVVSAIDTSSYKNVRMHRTVYLVTDGMAKFVVDLFDVRSPDEHQYDLPFHFNGQIIGTSFKYKAAANELKPLGTKNGYQFLWKEAEAGIKDTMASVTFLNGQTYYTISTIIKDSGTVFFTRSGANDPNFNLRREPAFIVRKKAKNQLFVSLLDIHGNYDPVSEVSVSSYATTKLSRVIRHDENYTVVEIASGRTRITIAQCNNNFDANARHKIQYGTDNLSWTGPYVVDLLRIP